MIADRPDLILDNGGDLFAKYLDAPYDGLRGGTEETTSGRMRLEPLRDRLKLPILVINDSPIKQFAENEHAVGQSSLESYLRFTNRVTNGEQVTVFGYGACGRGVAASFRGACARVTVVDTDPVARLRAHLDGFAAPPREEAIASADVIITVTGARDVLTAADLPLLRDGVIVANAGHFPAEIDVEAIAGSAGVAGLREYADDLMTLELTDGRRIHVISRGHMFNLAGPRPLGNSIESMDLGFALQARCLEAVANGSVDASSCVVPVPGRIDAAIATSYLDRKYPRRAGGPSSSERIAGPARRSPASAGDEGQVRVGAPLGQRAVVQPGVVAAGQREREEVDRRGDAAAAVGDDRLVRADPAAVEGGGELGGRAEAVRRARRPGRSTAR